MYFINFAGSEKRIDPTKGKYFYSPNQKTQSRVITPEAAQPKSEPKVSNADSRTPTRGNAGGMRRIRKGGPKGNVFKSMASPNSKNKLGAKIGKALRGIVKITPGKAALGLAVAGGLGYAASKALQNRKPKSLQDKVSGNPLVRKLSNKLRKMRSDKGRKRK